MRRRNLYLVGSLVSLVKPFLVGGLAVSLGLTDSGGATSSFLRYLIFPQIVPAVCLFFLFRDESRYGAYRPLAALFSIGSTLLFAVGAVAGRGNIASLFLHVQDLVGFYRQALLVLAVDLVDLIVLLFGKAPKASAPSGPSPAAGAGEGGEKGATLPDEETK